MFGRKIKTKEEQERWEAFFQLGMKNDWMNGNAAIADGDFIVEEDRLNKNKGFIIEDKEELKEFFKQGNWCLGESVMYKDFCFMNQIDGGDEWMVVKYGKDGTFSFESWSCARMIESGEFDKNLESIEKATDEQLRKWDY
jgi:hypothetical protein